MTEEPPPSSAVLMQASRPSPREPNDGRGRNVIARDTTSASGARQIAPTFEAGARFRWFGLQLRQALQNLKATQEGSRRGGRIVPIVADENRPARSSEGEILTIAVLPDRGPDHL